MDRIDDVDDEVIEIIDLVTPKKTIHHKKRLIAQYLEEQQVETLADISFAQDFGLSESFIINELNQFAANNAGTTDMMDDIMAMLIE